MRKSVMKEVFQVEELKAKIKELYAQASADLGGSLGKSDSVFFEALGRRNALNEIYQLIEEGNNG